MPEPHSTAGFLGVKYSALVAGFIGGVYLGASPTAGSANTGGGGGGGGTGQAGAAGGSGVVILRYKFQ